MEPFCNYNMIQINHHSFMRWSKGANKKKEEEAAGLRVLDVDDLDMDSPERSLMITAFSV